MWFTSKEKAKEHADKLIKKARQERDKENIIEALSLLEKAIRLDKEYATPYGEYGIVLALYKNNDQAEYNGHFAIVKASKCVTQWRNLAQIYYLLGRFHKAYVAILVAETLDPQLENVQKLKSLIKAIMSPDQLKDIDQIEQNTKQAFSKYAKQEIIMPEQFIEDALSI